MGPMSQDAELNAEPSFQQPPSDQPYLRASDADRQAALDIIDRGYQEGRLTPDEHTERSDQALRARTQPELNVLTADLIVIQDAHHADELAMRPDALPAPTHYSSNAISSILSTKEREGRWLVPPTLQLHAFMGTLKVDLREASFESLTTHVDLTSVMSEIKVWIPAGAEVIDETRMFMSETKFKKLDPPVPGRPRIVFTGTQVMASLIIYGRGHVTLGDRIKGNF